MTYSPVDVNRPLWRFFNLSIKEQSIGVKVRAEIVEMVMMIHIIQPSCLKSTPAIPVTIVNGKNTAIMVNVEATTEIATSCVA